MALTCNALVALVGYAGRLKANQRHHTAQEEVYLFELGKLLQYAGAHQAVVSVVVHHLSPHGVQQFIKTFGGKTFKESIGIALTAHTVHHIAAVPISIHHAVHGVDVVLAVAIDGNCDVAAVFCLHQACQHCVLVPTVAALADTDIVFITGRQLVDDLPGAIPRAIIHKQHPAVGADLPCRCQVVDFLQKQRCRNRQHLLLIIAGDDDVKDRVFSVIHS